MTTTNVSTTKMYCACSGKWCEIANLQGFCTLTACRKGVIYDDHTTIIKCDELQTEVKIEPSWVGETYGHFKTE